MAEAVVTDKDLEATLARLPNWMIVNGKLHREYTFANFVEAFGFMTQVALLAERMNHHPGWSNEYKKVTVDLVTHEANGITSKDLDLAELMEELVAE